MSDSLHVEFGTPRHGWMPLTLRAGPAHLEIGASYTPYDSVRDLAGAVALTLKGGPGAVVRWNEEPTEYEFRFVVDPGAPGANARVSVVRLGDRRGNAGVEVLRVAGGAADVCLPFWRALRRLASSMPPAAFESAWGHPFPADKLDEVAALLGRATGAADTMPSCDASPASS